MRKVQLFRDALAAAFPEFDGRARDKLSVFVENGRIRARPAPGTSSGIDSFEYAYRLEAILLDFAGDPNLVMATTLDWLREHQPELLLAHDGAPIEIQADVIDDERVDLQISLELSEAVRRTAGGFEYVPEPRVEDHFGDAAGMGTLAEVFAGGEQLLP